MTSCILTLYIAIAAFGSAVPLSQPPGSAADPDALYAQRENLDSARQAAAIWAERLEKNPADFEAAWKLARARYWLGGHAPEDEGKQLLEEGIAAGRAAVRIEPDRPEGHFWIAANMGALAESYGMRQGLKYRGDIKDELEIVLKLDPGFQQGSADRALGRWYYKVPGFFGGSDSKAEEHLRKSLTYNPNSTASLYFLAETLIELDREDEARKTLQQILEAPVDPDWAPEDREFKEKARALLEELKDSFQFPASSFQFPASQLPVSGAVAFPGRKDVGHYKRTTGYWLLATGYWLLATDKRQYL